MEDKLRSFEPLRFACVCIHVSLAWVSIYIRRWVVAMVARKGGEL